MKMKKILSMLLTVAFPVLTNAAGSMPSGISPPATLKEVAQRAVLNSPEVTAKWHAYRAAVAD